MVVFYSDARPVRIVSCGGNKGLDEGLFVDERERERERKQLTFFVF